MIKLYKNWTLLKTYNWVNVSNILACATILSQYGIKSKTPWKDIITRARREKNIILKSY